MQLFSSNDQTSYKFEAAIDKQCKPLGTTESIPSNAPNTKNANNNGINTSEISSLLKKHLQEVY